MHKRITKSNMKVGRGYTNTLSVVGVKNGGTWSSSNKSIATVTFILLTPQNNYRF